MRKIFHTTVSVKDGTNRNVLRGIVQYDTLNEVNIRLFDGSKAFNYEGYTNIIFKVLKADGTRYIDSEGENVIATDPSDGIVTVILKGQATTAAGLCQSVVEIYSAEGKMTTARFNYEVFEELNTDEATVSESQYPVFQKLMADLSALKSGIMRTVETIETAEEERFAAEAARKDAETDRKDKETGYVAQAAAHANTAISAAITAGNRAQEASAATYLANQYSVEARDSATNASQSAKEATASAAEAKTCETKVLEAKVSAEQSATYATVSAQQAVASESAAKAAQTAAELARNEAQAIAGGDFASVPYVNAHINNKSNPHGVTATQINALPASLQTPWNTDFDTLTTQGVQSVYLSGSTNKADYHAPLDGADWYHILVIGTTSHDRLTQIVTTPFRFTKRVFIRFKHDDIWSDWFEVYTSNRKPTAADVGAPTVAEMNTAIANAIGTALEASY